MDARAGESAAAQAQAAADRIRNLSSEMTRERSRRAGFAAAARSEALTAEALMLLASRGWRVLHDRRWPGSARANVDHVAVGPPGVALIDTKSWSRAVHVRDGRLMCGEYDRHDAVETLLRLTAAVENLLLDLVADAERTAPVGLSPVHVLPVLAFTEHNRGTAPNARLGRVWLTAIWRLPLVLGGQGAVLSPAQIDTVAGYLERALPAATPSARAVTVRSRVAVPARPEPLPGQLDRNQAPDGTDTLFDVPDVAEQLATAARAPLVEWMGFLHPSQARLVRRRFSGPARLRGPTGTGKSAVLLHRAAWLAETRPGRVLVTSFVRTLPHQQRPVYERLSPRTVDRVDFLGVHEVARQLLAAAGQQLNVRRERCDDAFDGAWDLVGDLTGLSAVASKRYWREEIDSVVKGRGLVRFGEYEGLLRVGRSIRLSSKERAAVWDLLMAYDRELRRRGNHDHNDELSAAVDLVQRHPPRPGWAAVLVDEVQDMPLLAMRLCALLAGHGPDRLLLVGDGQQAIYPGGFTLAEAGISVTGRAVVLRVNYRNTRQILDDARTLVEDSDFSDLDVDPEPGHRDVEVLRDGRMPVYETAPDRRHLLMSLARALAREARNGIGWGEMAVLTLNKSDAALLRGALRRRNIAVGDLFAWDGRPDQRVKVDTVHRSKGLDFAAVFLPQLGPDTVDPSGDEGERELLRLRQQFVGRTRARDFLWIGRVRRPRSPGRRDCPG